MAKHQLLLLLTVFYTIAYAQPYEPLLIGYNEWTTVYCTQPTQCYTDYYISKDDTVYDGKTYKMLDLYHFNKAFFIREDVSERKVYMLTLSDGTKARDYLIYDFGVNVNDTVAIYNPSSPIVQGPVSYIADSIVYKDYLGKSRKTIYLSNVNQSVSETLRHTVWVEGIGSLSLINTPGSAPDPDGIGELLCMQRDGITIYSSDISFNDNCQLNVPTSLLEQESAIDFRYSTTLNSLIFNNETNNPFTLAIYNVVGQMIFYIPHSSINSLNLSPLPAGMYVATIQVGEKFSQKKFLVY